MTDHNGPPHLMPTLGQWLLMIPCAFVGLMAFAWAIDRTLEVMQ